MVDYTAVAGGSIAIILLGSVLSLIRKNGDIYRRLDSKVGHNHCKDLHEQQTETNIELITKVAVIETKLDLGFKRIEEKIDENGRK